MEIKFKSIGIVHTKGSDTEVREKGDLEGELEIYPEFREGLQGIDDYSQLFILVYFDWLRPEQIGPLQVKPRGLVRRGFKLEELPLIGVFAIDSPTRPNPIGLTCISLNEKGTGFSCRKWTSSTVRRFSISKVTGPNIVLTTTSCQIGFALWLTTKVKSNTSLPQKISQDCKFQFHFPQ